MLSEFSSLLTICPGGVMANIGDCGQSRWFWQSSPASRSIRDRGTILHTSLRLNFDFIETEKNWDTNDLDN